MNLWIFMIYLSGVVVSITLDILIARKDKAIVTLENFVIITVLSLCFSWVSALMLLVLNCDEIIIFNFKDRKRKY